MNQPADGCRCRATSLIEVMASLLILSAFLVAAVNTVGATVLTQVSASQRARGTVLAQELMEEILSHAYAEPFEEMVFGPEESETGGNRVAFDDVDDYHGWSSSPPQSAAGAARSQLQGWSRAVAVAWVSPTDLTVSSGTETGIKRITVTVQFEGKGVAKVETVMTESWVAPPYE